MTVSYWMVFYLSINLFMCLPLTPSDCSTRLPFFPLSFPCSLSLSVSFTLSLPSPPPPLPPAGFGKSPASESVKSEQSRVDLLKHFLEALGVRAPALITPSMSGHYALPFLQRFSDQLRAFVPIAPVATRTLTPQQYHDIQVCVCVCAH